MNRSHKLVLATAMACAFTAPAEATVTLVGTELITFDEAIGGLPFFNFDSNDPGTETDVVFSTTDPTGFNTTGPGPDQLFINEPGLEGTTDLAPDLRVDFLQGAVGQLAFGFATIDQGSATFTAYNAADIPIGSRTVGGDFFDLDGLPGGPQSLFPENEVIVPLAGTAVYGEFDFQLPFEGGRYIIDNFNFTPAGEDVISVIGGALPDNPLLPGEIVFDADGIPEFIFDFPIDPNGLGGIFPIFIDPVVAVGYDYTSSINVTSILIPSALPNGDDIFRLVIPGVGTFTLMAGVTFDVTSVLLGGVDAFTIDGIDTAELLDPTDPTAFVTGLTFDGGGTAITTMTPITFDTDSVSVPEPGTLLLVALGFAGLHRFRKANVR